MLKPNKMQNNTQNKEMIEKYHDAIIAIDYIAHELQSNKINDLAQILRDIAQVYMQGQENTQDENKNIHEYNGILYVYFIQKYYKSIKDSSAKHKILDFFKNEINKSTI